MILTYEEIAALAHRADGAGPTEDWGLLFARAVERAALEKAARKIEAGETGVRTLNNDAGELLRVWAGEDARARWP